MIFPDKSKTFLLAALICLSAVVAYFKSPYNASNLTIVPDSVEYATAASHIEATGNYCIELGDRRLPPRYPPWFSLLFIAPCYSAAGASPGNAIWPVTTAAVIGVVTAFYLGRHIAGDFAGFMASLFLLVFPVYRNFAREIMTDIPCVTLIIIECLLYLKIRDSESPPLALDVCAGLAAALCAALRPVCASVLIPFIIHTLLQSRRRRIAARLTVLILPLTGFAVMTLIYNKMIFGSFFRTGYHFWCPIPYDFPWTTWNTKYFSANIKTLASSGSMTIILLSGAILLFAAFFPRSRNLHNRNIRRALVFAVMATGPIAILHLFYFFPSPRLFLPFTVMLMVPAGATAGSLIRTRSGYVPVVLQAAALVCLAGLRIYYPDPSPCRRITADRIMNHTPAEALVISVIDPVYLQFMTGREILPMSREVEYASKITARKKLRLKPEDQPVDWTDFPRKKLVEAGGTLPVPFVAADLPDFLLTRIKQDNHVYVDTSVRTGAAMTFVSLMKKKFTLQEEALYLYRIRPAQKRASPPGNH